MTQFEETDKLRRDTFVDKFKVRLIVIVFLVERYPKKIGACRGIRVIM